MSISARFGAGGVPSNRRRMCDTSVMSVKRIEGDSEIQGLDESKNFDMMSVNASSMAGVSIASGSSGVARQISCSSASDDDEVSANNTVIQV